MQTGFEMNPLKNKSPRLSPEAFADQVSPVHVLILWQPPGLANQNQTLKASQR